jgi:hypothetical protein
MFLTKRHLVGSLLLSLYFIVTYCISVENQRFDETLGRGGSDRPCISSRAFLKFRANRADQNRTVEMKTTKRRMT